MVVFLDGLLHRSAVRVLLEAEKGWVGFQGLLQPGMQVSQRTDIELKVRLSVTVNKAVLQRKATISSTAVETQQVVV